MANDNTLIYRAQTGDEGAFTDLMREYYPFVYTIVIRIVDNPHDVEEVVQDTFLSAYRGLTQLENAAKFKSWLAEIARNCARQWIRKRRINTVSLDEVGEGVLQTQDSPDEQLARLEQRELIRRTMETLPQKDRDIARAFYLEGASYDELTSTHGLSDKAISFRLSRAKQQLSKRLRYLLTGMFVSPGLTLKKLYTRGLTAMKVGTTPKMTVGVTGLIGLILIGFIGLRQMNAPIVEERVYLSPWEDGTTRPRNNPERLPAATAQDTASWNNLPQIAAITSTVGTEPIDDFVGELEGTDMAQFTIGGRFDIDTVQGFTTGPSASSESTGQSAEDVMYAYFEAWRNLDYRAMGSVMTEQYRREGHEDPSDGDSVDISDESSDEAVETMSQFERMAIEEKVRERRKQALLVSSEYVDDEFHFRLITPGSKLPNITDQGMPVFCCTTIHQIKMRRENGVWRVYDAVTSIESAIAEVPAANMRNDMGRSDHDDSEIPIGIREVQHESLVGMPAEAVEAMAEEKTRQLEPRLGESFREMQAQASARNGESVDDEFHFRLRMPAPKIPDGGERGIEMSVTVLRDTVIKMRKEEEVRRMYEGEMLD